MKLQLFALVLVLLPGSFVVVTALVRTRMALEHAVGQQLAEVAHDAIEEIAGELANQRMTVRNWARQDVMRELRVGDVDKRVARFLRSVVDGGEPYLELSCFDRTGRVVASTDPARVGSVHGDEVWLREALAGRDAIEGPSATTATATAAVDIAVPIPDPDGSAVPIGVLRGRYDWADAMAVAERIRRTLKPHGLTIDILLFDRQGAIMGESWSDATRGEVRDAAVALARTVPPMRERGWTKPPGAHVLVGYERGDDTQLGWLALAIEPLREAYAPVYELQRQLGLILGAVLLAALLLATYWAERISRPLRALTQATREIADLGTARRPVVVRSRDEIGELGDAFNAMSGELERAQDELLTAAKLAFVGELAAGIAHEVRTPLGILRSSAQMMSRALPPGQPKAMELADMMIDEVDRLSRVVDGLLQLARPHEPSLAPTPLDAVLRRALEFVTGQAREKGIALRAELPPTVPPAMCDGEQIYQVALNLIVNALQILPAGGTIVVRTEALADDRVAFTVTDDGPGIDAELHERIFTPFFSRRKGGTGLGLALVQRIAQAHHGVVTVTSRAGHGATFRVELPRARTT